MLCLYWVMRSKLGREGGGGGGGEDYYQFFGCILKKEGKEI